MLGPLTKTVDLPPSRLGVAFDERLRVSRFYDTKSPLRGLVDVGDRVVAISWPGMDDPLETTDMGQEELVSILAAYQTQSGRRLVFDVGGGYAARLPPGRTGFLLRAGTLEVDRAEMPLASTVKPGDQVVSVNGLNVTPETVGVVLGAEEHASRTIVFKRPGWQPVPRFLEVRVPKDAGPKLTVMNPEDQSVLEVRVPPNARSGTKLRIQLPFKPVFSTAPPPERQPLSSPLVSRAKKPSSKKPQVEIID